MWDVVTLEFGEIKLGMRTELGLSALVLFAYLRVKQYQVNERVKLLAEGEVPGDQSKGRRLLKLISKHGGKKGWFPGKKGWFPCSGKDIERDTGFNIPQQTKLIRKLKVFGLIDTKLVGLPAKRWIMVEPDWIETFKDNLKEATK